MPSFEFSPLLEILRPTGEVASAKEIVCSMELCKESRRERWEGSDLASFLSGLVVGGGVNGLYI